MNTEITLRDYFAAHAPTEIEDWFFFQFRSRPIKPEGADYCEGCKAGGNCEKTKACLDMQNHTDALCEWKEERQKASKLQWRWAWADAMIETGYGK